MGVGPRLAAGSPRPAGGACRCARCAPR
jgi:hypothetical protein